MECIISYETKQELVWFTLAKIFFKQPPKQNNKKSMILNEKKTWEQWEFLTEHEKREKDGVKKKKNVILHIYMYPDSIISSETK